MQGTKQEKPETRLRRYVTDMFEQFLRKHPLPMHANNDLLDVRNRFYRFFKSILAEMDTKKRYDIDVDYLLSDVSRIILHDVDSPYWLNGEIVRERPPGPTNEEIAQLTDRVTRKIMQLETEDRGACSRLAQEVVAYIRQTFTLPNHNIPFTKRFYDRTPNSDWTYRQNTPCEVCGENRAIDRCHIIPNEYGGSAHHANIMYLCPTHHRLFDRGMLTEEEWNSIDFGKKGKLSANFAYYVLKPKFAEFWRDITNHQFAKRSPIHIAPSTAELKSLQAEMQQEVISLLRSDPGLTAQEMEGRLNITKTKLLSLLAEAKRNKTVKVQRSGRVKRYYLNEESANQSSTKYGAGVDL